MTKTFIYNKNLETMYTEEAFKKEYAEPCEWSTDLEEWFNDYCNIHNISFTDILTSDKEDKADLCKEFLDWFITEYENGADFCIFCCVEYEE